MARTSPPSPPSIPTAARRPPSSGSGSTTATSVFSATEDRRKVRNLRRDPRLGVSITDAENPYRHTQLRGTAELTPDPGKALPKALSHKYLAQDPPPEGPEVERVVVRLKVDRIAGNVK